ncbi:folate-binding protein [uncultured Marinobacter sp.]|uniref:CAF17-like 4Fe-4S cluster assembly/insertion protein YgfZ n=1 Tax=uncultured Marinobacter sp. TaxID=187379 RepID=UPI0030D918A6
MSAINSHFAHFPLPDSGIAELTYLRVFRVSGPGTDTFLQGQFSQNLAEVTSGHAPRAAASNPKGRTYLLTRMVREGADVLLAIPDSIADHACAQLNKYLMLFRGTTMTPAPDYRIFGLLGSDATEALTGSTDGLNQPCDVLQLDDNRHLIRTESTATGLIRHELWGRPVDSTDGHHRAGTITESDWLASEIAAGVASLSPETIESYVPQMLNWQHLNGVHFKKGCYTGQEVIARMHYLGQLKKSLFRLACPPGSPVAQPGTVIVANERQAGEVINAAAYSDGHQELLAVLRHDTVAGPLQLGDSNGPALMIDTLPYPVPEQDAAEPAPKDT